MIISYAWTTDALLAGRKTVTRRDWSKEYAARFRGGTVHSAYSRQARFGGEKVGDVRILKAPYPEATRDIPYADYENEGLAYMEEKGLLIQKKTPWKFFEDWRKSDQVLFVVRFELVFLGDRCNCWTTGRPFGYPENDKRLCPLCWVDWTYYSERELKRGFGSEEWEAVYGEFIVTKRKGVFL